MKKKLVSLIMAAALTTGTTAGVFAADNSGVNMGVNMGVAMADYGSMSESDKRDFINANLSVRLQHLSRLASISSNQALDRLDGEIKSALADGLTAVEIKEAIYHSGAYCGFTRAAAALDRADSVLKSLGEDVTYRSRITSEENTRYADGLAVQRVLFGPQIGTITDGMEESLKMQTLFLSGICFGDFYNRVGLSLYEREFITLCTIAGNGNCRGQLNGHVNGNLNVGHSKNMLRAAMLYNGEINGREKTDLVLDVIDTIKTEVNVNPKEERPQPVRTVAADFKSDSEELLSLMAHFKSDDKDGYVDGNLSGEVQDILIRATKAAIDKKPLPASDDNAVQVLIDIAVMGAQGGREAELPGKVAEGLAAGLTKDNMLAVPLLIAPYNGFPRTLNMRGGLSAALDTAAAPIDNVFARGGVNPSSARFTGASYLNWLSAYDGERMKIPAFGQVTFEPCTRTDWHYHDGGQILLVTEGTGVFLMEGEAAKIMQAGDVILIPPGKRHIHCAIDDSWFAHIAIGVNPGAGGTHWLDKVTDAEYAAAVKAARANSTIRAKGDTMFPKGREFTAQGYRGRMYKNVLVEHESVFNCPEVDNFTMEAGAGTDWHIHESGQLILVTNGSGIYQEEGQPPRIIKAGDVIEAQPGVKHWHGAAGERLAYIAVNGNPGRDKITWGSTVTDKEVVAALASAAVPDGKN